jgi:hypothetical protein
MLDRKHEPVSAPRHGLDVTIVVRCVAQCGAKLQDRRIDAAIKLHHRVARPESFAYLLARDHPSLAQQQHLQDLKLLLRQARASPVARQVCGLGVKREGSKTNKTVQLSLRGDVVG